jgi:hypothetical protein
MSVQAEDSRSCSFLISLDYKSSIVLHVSTARQQLARVLYR